MEPTIIFDRVSKKFSKGYVSDSLRDAIVAPFKKLFRTDGKFNPIKLLKPAKETGPEESTKQMKDEFWALKNVSFEVRPGEILGLIGPNGSGKSTTLKLLSRVLRPDDGKIVVKGRVGTLIELGAGFHPDLTGRENVFLNASILGMSKEEIKKKYDEIVDFAELHEFMDTPVKWYSSGMYARLGFSVATFTDPDILLIDEVLSVGDIGFQTKCLERMQYFKKQGMTIVFISHNMQSIAYLCDRVILLKKGSMEKVGGTEEILSYYMGAFKKDYLYYLPGSTRVELKKGSLYNEVGDECSTFKGGQRARIEVALKFLESFSCIHVTIGVLKMNGQLISWTNSRSLSGHPLSVSREQILNLSVDILLNLAPGEYELNTTIYDPMKNITMWEARFAPFLIQKDIRSGGTVFIDPRLIEQRIIT